MFSSFAQEKLYVHPEIGLGDDPETSSSSRSGDSYTISPADHASSDISDNTSRPGTPDHSEHTKDDMAVSSRPSCQVDYLSHNWSKEDIWSSWRYIVLYGPLQPLPNVLNSTQTKPSKVPLSKTDPPSLLKQATAAVKVDETRGILWPDVGRTSTGYPSQPFSQRRLDGESSSANPSTESSGIASPNCERKRTHLNERGMDHDSDELGTGRYGDDSDPGDGVMVKRTNSKKPLRFQQNTLESKPAKGKTISMLPPTTLKYQEDTPEPQGTASKHSRSPIMPQNILRPVKQPPTLCIGEEGDKDSLDDVLLSPCTRVPLSPTEDANGGLSRSLSSESLYKEPACMRRTPSGMFMSYGGRNIFRRWHS
ncbi:hypothetical protein DER44DRAFT_816540 [Fusarium oxysporum]|nr:hypothetical protein DER44DRAFT_816540 [Fusarium oxysporum]